MNMINIYSAHGCLKPTSIDVSQGHIYGFSPDPFPLCPPILT